MNRIISLLILTAVSLTGIQAAKPTKGKPQKIANSIAASLNKPTAAFTPSPATDKIVMSVSNGSIQYFNPYFITVTPDAIDLTVMSPTTAESVTETYSFPAGKSFKGLLKTVTEARVINELDENMMGMCGNDHVEVSFYKGEKPYHAITDEMKGDPYKIMRYITSLIPDFYNVRQELIDRLDSPGYDPFEIIELDVL